MYTPKTWAKLCKNMKKLSLYQSCLIDKFRKSYKTLLVIALFFPPLKILIMIIIKMKKIKKWKKDNKASLKQQQQYLGDPFDNLKSVSTTLRENFFPISIEIRKRFNKQILKTNFIPWWLLLVLYKISWCDQGSLLNKCCTSDKIWNRHLLLLWDTMPIQISITCAEVFEKKLWTTNPKGVIGFFAQKMLERLIYILIFFQLFAFNLKELGKMFFNREMANQIRALKKISAFFQKAPPSLPN